MTSKRLLCPLLLALAALAQPLAAAAQAPAATSTMRVAELVGLPIVDADRALMGRVRAVVRTVDGKDELIMPIGGLFGFGERLVAIPIEGVVLSGSEVAVREVPPDRFQLARTWYGSGSAALAPTETVQIARR
jgi:hypothetical protein